MLMAMDKAEQVTGLIAGRVRGFTTRHPWGGDLSSRMVRNDSVVNGDDHQVLASLDAPTTAEAAEHAKLHGFKQRVLQALRDAAEPIPKAEVERRVTGRSEHVRAAITALEGDGAINCDPAGTRHLLSLVETAPK